MTHPIFTVRPLCKTRLTDTTRRTATAFDRCNHLTKTHLPRRAKALYERLNPYATFAELANRGESQRRTSPFTPQTENIPTSLYRKGRSSSANRQICLMPAEAHSPPNPLQHGVNEGSSPYLRRTIALPGPLHVRVSLAKPEHEAAQVGRWYGEGIGMVGGWGRDSGGEGVGGNRNRPVGRFSPTAQHGEGGFRGKNATFAVRTEGAGGQSDARGGVITSNLLAWSNRHSPSAVKPLG